MDQVKVGHMLDMLHATKIILQYSYMSDDEI